MGRDSPLSGSARLYPDCEICVARPFHTRFFRMSQTICYTSFWPLKEALSKQMGLCKGGASHNFIQLSLSVYRALVGIARDWFASREIVGHYKPECHYSAGKFMVVRRMASEKVAEPCTLAREYEHHDSLGILLHWSCVGTYAAIPGSFVRACMQKVFLMKIAYPSAITLVLMLLGPDHCPKSHAST